LTEAIDRRAALLLGGAVVLGSSVGAAAAGPTRIMEGFAEVDGARLYFRDTGGTGQVLMLAHPVSGSALVWGNQEQAFAQAGYRVIAWSRRDHARTESESGSIDRGTVADLQGLADHLNVPRFHALGSAAGGGAMLDFALAHPERVRTLIVANNVGNIADPAFLARSNALRPAPFATMPVSFRELGPTYRAANPEGVARWEALERQSRSAPLGPPPAGTVQWGDLRRITMPVLWLTGDADFYAPPPMLSEHRRRVARSELKVIGGVGHSAYWENPEAFNRAVLDFLHRRG
jgi:pimeloyl-ACP methyl ester carboxylesterase